LEDRRRTRQQRVLQVLGGSDGPAVERQVEGDVGKELVLDECSAVTEPRHEGLVLEQILKGEILAIEERLFVGLEDAPKFMVHHH